MTHTLETVYRAIGQGDWIHAQAQCRRLLLEGVNTPAVHHALGISLCGTGAYDEAVEPFSRAVELDPVTPAWARDAGALYAKLGRWSDARAVLMPVIGKLDAQGVAIFLTAATATGEAQEALALMTPAAIADLHDDPDALCAYGRALLSSSQYSEAEAVLTECLRRFPDQLDAREALAQTYDATSNRERALECWRIFAASQPHNARAHLKLAIACSDRGRWEDSKRARQHADMLGLRTAEEYASRVYLMLSDPDETAETILAAAASAFPDRPPSTLDHRPRRRRRSRRLRIGYLSSAFEATPSFYFTYPFLANHDRSRVEVFLYSVRHASHNSASSGQSLGEHFRELDPVSDAELGAVLRADRLDVLVHMAGHFSYSGLHAVCERVAPVQICYPNFPSTTGCPGMDYMITDPWMSPTGSESEYSERLYRLPNGSLVYAAPADGPPISDLPLLGGRTPTFGIFQRLAKFNEPFCDAVAAALMRVPSANLLIHNGDSELDDPASSTSLLLKKRFDTRGIDPARVRLKGPLAYRDHLELVGRVDVALDTFPYGGQTTTCESMWMGVPVVTLSQNTHVSRVSAAILARAGYGDWVAHGIDQYGDIAASLVTNVDRLKRLRQSLRSDFVNAGLTNGRVLAQSLEDAYEVM